MGYLARKTPSEVRLKARLAVSEGTLREAGEIIDDVRTRGGEALRHYAGRFNEIGPGESMVLGRSELQRSLEEIPSVQREVLERVAQRIDGFARAQLACITPLSVAVPGGTAGHSVTPVDVAGCYAPGGRFPLPSSVLMTAVVARAAGVETVWVASPRPGAFTRAAAAIAGADGLLCAGGAHAIAAMAYGVAPVPRCDVIVGPGNRYVTAAKQIVSSGVAIDMLAGPSEVVIVADHTADPEEVASDLLAQAEHDPDAMPVLISLDETLPDRVEGALERQLTDLPTAGT
ncbi:MAG: histidinol dehydrogenase, partial [Myxococcota bacterium]